MQFKSIEEFWNYLDQAYADEPAATTEDTPPEFDNNAKAVNALFRNAMNEKHFSAAYAVLVYANEQQIILTKGR